MARVAGDADAGFYRRRWEAEQIWGDTADERLEAYSCARRKAARRIGDGVQGCSRCR